MVHDDDANRAFERFRETGDPEAFQDVFAATVDSLTRAARRYAAGKDDVEDLVQATYVSAIESRGRFEPGRRVLPWLQAILRHHALRLRRRSGVITAGLDDETVAPFPTDAVQSRDVHAYVASRIRTLDAPYRRILEDRLFRGLTPLEIATEHSLLPSTVRSRLSRGLERLRTLLGVLCAMVALSRSGNAGSGLRRSPLAFLVMASVLVSGLLVLVLWVPASTWHAPRAEPLLDGHATPGESMPRATRTVRRESTVEDVTSTDTVAFVHEVQVVSALDGRSLADVELAVRNEDVERDLLRVTTDERGVARFVMQGDDLTVHMPASSVSAEISHGVRGAVRLVVPPGLSVEGVLLDLAGVPVGDAVLCVREPDGRSYRVGHTGRDGRFVVRGLSPSRVHVLHAIVDDRACGARFVSGGSGETLTGVPLRTGDPGWLDPQRPSADGAPVRYVPLHVRPTAVDGLVVARLPLLGDEPLWLAPLLDRDGLSVPIPPGESTRWVVLHADEGDDTRAPRPLARMRPLIERLVSWDAREILLELEPNDVPSAWLTVRVTHDEPTMLVVLDRFGLPRLTRLALSIGMHRIGPLPPGTWQPVYRIGRGAWTFLDLVDLGREQVHEVGDLSARASTRVSLAVRDREGTSVDAHWTLCRDGHRSFHRIRMNAERSSYRRADTSCSFAPRDAPVVGSSSSRAMPPWSSRFVWIQRRNGSGRFDTPGPFSTKPRAKRCSTFSCSRRARTWSGASEFALHSTGMPSTCGAPFLRMLEPSSCAIDAVSPRGDRSQPRMESFDCDRSTRNARTDAAMDGWRCGAIGTRDRRRHVSPRRRASRTPRDSPPSAPRRTSHRVAGTPRRRTP